MHEHPSPSPEPDPWAAEPLALDSELDWEALKAGPRLHLYCYLRDTVLALASLDAAA